MTREEALNILHNSSVYHPMYLDALEQAIQALEQQPCEDCVSLASVFEIMGNLMSIPYDFDRPITKEDVSESMDEVRALPSVTPIQSWIPTSEKLPKPKNNGDKDFSDWLQITIKIGHSEPKDAYVSEGYYCFSEQKWYTKRFVIGEVTAWMPLPKPYKESEG